MATDKTATLENLNIPQEIQRFESEVPVETSPPPRNKINKKHKTSRDFTETLIFFRK